MAITVGSGRCWDLPSCAIVHPVTKQMLWDRCWVEWNFLPDNYVNIIDARISALRRRLKEQAPELGEDLHPLIVSARSRGQPGERDGITLLLVPADAPGVTDDPDNPISGTFGENMIKARLRAHPDVAARHHPDLARGGDDTPIPDKVS